MKKQLAFLSIALCGGVALAQLPAEGLDLPSVQTDFPKVEMVSAVRHGAFEAYSSPFSRQAKAPMIEFNVMAGNGDGVYYAGLDEQFMGTTLVMAYGSIAAPSYFKASCDNPDAAPTYTWSYVSGAEQVPMETREDGQARLFVIGAVEYPVVNATASDGTQLDFDRGNSSLAGSQGAYYLTMANHERPISMFDYASTGMYYPGWQLEDGTTMRLGSGYGISEAVQVFNRTSTPLVIYGGQFPVFLASENENQDYMINNAKMTVEIWTCEVDDNYRLSMGSCLASTEIGRDDLSYNEDGQGIFAFEFTSVDEFGMEVSAPVVVPSQTNFAVVVKGLDNDDLNLCIDVAPDGRTNTMRLPGYAYYRDAETGSYSYPWEEVGVPYSELNTLISLDADYPGVAWAFDTMSAPDAGGYLETEALMTDGSTQMIQYNVLYTSMPMQSTETGEDNFVVDLPDWVSVETINSIESSGWNSSAGMGYITAFVADPLPSGVAGRSGYISVRCPRIGMNWGIKVGQGEWDPDSMESGIESAEAATVNGYVSGDVLNIAYGEGFDRADVYSVSGVKVASYELPADGVYSVSVAGLADGVYVVALSGDKTETFKVVK